MGEPESRWLDDFATELLGWLELRRHQGVAVEELAGEVCARVSGALDALMATGHIDAEQERALRRRVAALADDATVSQPQTYLLDDAGGLVPDADPAPLVPVTPASALLRVVPVGRCVGLLGDERLTLVAAELWSDRVELSWFLPAAAEPAFPDWQLTDDAGTAYAVRSTGEDADADGVRGRVSFGPGLPPTARAFTVEVGVAGRTTARAEVALT